MKILKDFYLMRRRELWLFLAMREISKCDVFSFGELEKAMRLWQAMTIPKRKEQWKTKISP